MKTAALYFLLAAYSYAGVVMILCIIGLVGFSYQEHLVNYPRMLRCAVVSVFVMAGSYLAVQLIDPNFIPFR